MSEVRQGEYQAGDAVIRWTAVPTEADLADLQRGQEGKTLEVTCWRRGEDGQATVTAWGVPALAIDAFLFDHEGELGTIIGIREVQSATP